MSSSEILQAFNAHFIEFVDDIIRIFPDDLDIQTAKNFFIMVKKANPRLIIIKWQKYVVSTYGDEIDNGNIDFFINKDYRSDLQASSNPEKIINSIERLRDSIKQMDTDNLDKAIKYIQNLKNLSTVYFSNKHD